MNTHVACEMPRFADGGHIHGQVHRLRMLHVSVVQPNASDTLITKDSINELDVNNWHVVLATTALLPYDQQRGQRK